MRVPRVPRAIRWTVGLAALVGLVSISLSAQTGLPQVLMYGVNAGAPRALSVDASGNLNISASISGADGSIQDGVTPGIEATVLDLTNSNPLTVAITDASGNQITAFGGGTQYTNGSAQATPTGTVSLGWDGANVRALSTNASGQLNLNTIAGAITLPTGAATSANQSTEITALQLIDNLPLSQASTTSGQQGILMMGAVTTAAPSYTNAQTSPFSLALDGSLRVSGGGAGAQFAEDAAHTTGDLGTMALAVRSDTDASLAGTTGDYTPLQLDANGYLKVNIKAGAGSGGTASTDDAAFTIGSGSGTPMMGFATTDAVDSGDVGVLRMSTNRILYVTLSDATGTLLTPSTDVTEDAAETPGGTGPQVMSVRRDTATSSAGTSGDNATINTDAIGRLWISAAVAEDAAHTSGDIGLVTLGRRIDTLAASSGASGDYETFNFSSIGALWTTPVAGTNGGTTVFRSLDLDETEEDVKTSAGTLYSMWVTNTATATRWIKCYNATAANVTVGTTTPVITIGIPGNSTDDVAGHLGIGATGYSFSTALSCAATTGVADNDTGAPGTNDVIVNAFYL